MSIIGAKSLIMIGQYIGWDGRRTVFRSGAARMTTLKGVTKMIVYTSDHEELIQCLYMCTSNALRRSEAKKVFSSAPYQLADPEDLLDGIKEETQTPLTVSRSSFIHMEENYKKLKIMTEV